MIKRNFTQNRFEFLATQNMNKFEDENEIWKTTDLTHVFWNDVNLMLKNGELINWEVNAQVRKGKSTLVCAMGEKIVKLLVKNNKKPKGYKFSIQNIVRSQQEYSEVMKKNNLANDFIMIDEFDAMDDTGENSTTESKLREKMSDIFAGLYVHKIFCSPNENMDKNSDLFIQIVAVSKNTCETLCHIYYNLLQNNIKTKIPIGKCIFSVGKVINNWVKIEQMFVNNYEMNLKFETDKSSLNKTEILKLNNDNSIIENLRIKDYYIDYMVRKYFKMKLTTKESIFNQRELDNAEIILDLVNELKTMAKYTSTFDINMVKAYVDILGRKYKMVLSLIGKKEIIDKSYGILLQYKALHKNIKQIEYFKKKNITENIKLNKNLIKCNTETLYPIKQVINEDLENLNDDYNSKIKILVEVNTSIMKNINNLMEDLKYKIELKKVYLEKLSIK